MKKKTYLKTIFDNANSNCCRG